MIIRLGLICASAIFLAGAVPAPGEETPRSDSGNGPPAQVTVPYQEFKRLLDASANAKPEDSPDIPGTVTRAEIKLSFDPMHPSGEAEFNMTPLGINGFSFHFWV